MLEKIARISGVSPTQYSHLLQTEKIVEKRALKGQPLASNILNYVYSFIISATFFFIPMLMDISVYSYALIGITVSMVMIGIWTLPYFDILIYPINYPVVAHTPISSRTYFLVKLTQILSYTVKLLICLNLIPAIGGIWVRSGESSQLQFLFPLVYLPIAIISGIFTVGIMTIFAGYLTKLYAIKKLRNVAKISQGLFPLLFPSIWMIVYFFPNDVPKDVTIEMFSSLVKWLYVLPNGWFAGTVSVILGQIEVRFLILTALAVISTAFLFIVPLQSIAKTYSKYLSYLIEAHTKQKHKLKVKIPRFAKIIKNRVIRAGFCMSSIYLYRDKRILQSILAILGSSIGFFVLLTQIEKLSLGWMMKSFIPGLNLAFFMMFCYFGVAFVGGFLSIVRYSEHWKAAWMFKLTPLTTPLDLWRSVQITTLLYIVTPYTILLYCIAVFFWGVSAILYVLPNLIFLLYFILSHPKPASGLPFSEELNPRRGVTGCAHAIYVHLAMVGFIGIHLIAYLIHVWVYIGVYCVITVGGFIGFVYLFTKKE
jgi:hypothetical protein